MAKRPSEKYRAPKYDRDDPDQFPSRLKAAMARRNVSPAEFAVAAGMNKSAVYNYLAGDNCMKVEDLVKTANVLGTTVDYLIDKTKEPLPDPSQEAAANYTGLSGKAVEVLHLFNNGRNVSIQYETYEDCMQNEHIQETAAANEAPQFVTHSKEIRILPNKNALFAIRMLLEYDQGSIPRDDDLELCDDQMSYSSIFDSIFTMLFPQKVDKDDPEFAEFKAEKAFRNGIIGLREKINAEYGKDGRDYLARKAEAKFRAEFLKDHEALKSDEQFRARFMNGAQE